MIKNIWQLRIPTLLGLLVLGVGIFFTANFARSGLTLFGFASPSDNPENIRITNVTDRSFTVSYTTSGNVLGTISYGTSPSLGKIALDDRDQSSGTPAPYLTHYMTIKDLQPKTKYYFTILSGKTTYLNNNNPFSLKTAEALAAHPSDQAPIIGKIITPDGTSPEEAIVYITAENSQTLSILIKNDGSYIMPLNAVYKNDFSSYFQFDGGTKISMLIIGQDTTSQAILSINQANPVPVITLGSNYNFLDAGTPLSSSTSGSSSESASESSQINGFPSFKATELQESKPKIITPETDEKFSDLQPKFTGDALPNQSVEIIIQSVDEITTSVKADTKGKWSFRPDKPLSPGKHTITIKTKDSNGILQILTKEFTVFAEGSQFTEPSVSPVQTTPSPTGTLVGVSPTKASPSVTPTVTPSPTSTLNSTPTVTPTPIKSGPTEIPAPTEVTSITPIPTTPATGSMSLITTTIIALSAFVIGIMLFILTRGSTAI